MKVTRAGRKPRRHRPKPCISLAAYGLLLHIHLHLNIDGTYTWPREKTGRLWGVFESTVSQLVAELEGAGAVSVERSRDVVTKRLNVLVIRLRKPLSPLQAYGVENTGIIAEPPAPDQGVQGNLKPTSDNTSMSIVCLPQGVIAVDGGSVCFQGSPAPTVTPPAVPVDDLTRARIQLHRLESIMARGDFDSADEEEFTRAQLESSRAAVAALETGRK